MKSSLKSTKITFTVLLIIALLIIGLATYVTLAEGGNGANKPRPTKLPTPTPPVTKTEGDTTCDAVIVSVSTDDKIIKVYEPEQDLYLELKYNGSTDIKNRFGQITSASLIEAAGIAEISYDKETGQLYHLYLDNEFWALYAPANWKLDLEHHMFTSSGQNYRVSENVATFCKEGEYRADMLSRMDLINVYGKDQRVFAIELVKGHGTLLVENEAAFVGGSIYVDSVYKGEITAGFSMDLQEGSHEIVFSNGDYSGSRTIEMTRDGSAVIDMAEFSNIQKDYGYVNFMISPEEAKLYVDNFLYETNEAVKLLYGTHYVEVKADGYASWTGTVTVADERMNLSISLISSDEIKPTQAPRPTSVVIITPRPTLPEDVTSTPLPTPTDGATDATPTPTQGAAQGTEPSKEISIVWYPSAVVMVDLQYEGTTDTNGVKKLTLSYGTHLISLFRTTLDGVTEPKKYEVTVDDEMPALISIPMQ